MAGIFANVDSDIQKLQKLKQEIENVKKSLKSINVKVDIDIAQGLEAQLKSLTTQYDALAAKVGETEARITTSANKIIDASNKIIRLSWRRALLIYLLHRLKSKLSASALLEVKL